MLNKSLRMPTTRGILLVLVADRHDRWPVYVGCSPKTSAAFGATIPRFQYWLSSYARQVCASQPGLEAPADPVEWKTAWPIRTRH